MLTAEALASAVLGELLGVGASPAPSFDTFCSRVYPHYVHTRYQILIDEYLEQVLLYIATGGQQGIGRIMFFAPPRHGKTLKVSRLFPAYLMGRVPDTRLILSSYAMSLARKNSRFIRNLIASKLYQSMFPDIRLADDTASAVEWDIAGYEGGAIAAGIGGGITGSGAKLAIIDDPIKGRAEAESETYRERLKDWYTDDLLTRIEEPGGAIILMNTRWHQDDLAGWLLSDDSAHEWTVVSLPALAGENDLLGRDPGAALWEERYSAAKLHARREVMGEYSFAALYQQAPLPSGGGLFDATKIEIVDAAPECKRCVRFYDLAVTTGKTSDYTVGLKLGMTLDERPVILDMWRERRELPDVHEAIVQNAQMDGRDVPIRLEAEKAGIIQLQFLLRDSRMHPYTIDAKPPEGDKYTRAAPVAARVNTGRVLMVKASWNRAVLDELAVFNKGAHDDIVDAFSGAYDMLVNYGPEWDSVIA